MAVAREKGGGEGGAAVVEMEVVTGEESERELVKERERE